MIPSAFEYHRASSVDDAIELLKTHGPGAKLLAGGHSLIPALKLRLSANAHLIDIGRISELQKIEIDAGTLIIGAAATHKAIADSPDVQSKAPALAETAAMIGDVQVRNKGTLGGSLAHADPAADYPAILLAMEAQFVARNASGERMIAAVDFFKDLFSTVLSDDEILTAIHVPAQGKNTGAAYLKFPQPASRFAMVGCAAVLSKSNGACSDVRVGFTGVGHIPFRDSNVEDALRGKALDESNIAAAAENAASGIDVLSDHYASEDYRRHLAKVFAQRALKEAASRA